MIKVYVAGKYSGSNTVEILQNIGNGERTCSKLFEMGFAPYSPWCDRSFAMYNPKASLSIKQFYDTSIEWLKACDAMFLTENWEDSDGVKEEIKIATREGIPIFDDYTDILNWRSQCKIPNKKIENFIEKISS